MKQLLLITAISIFCFAPAYAGTAPNSSPTAPAQAVPADDDDDDNDGMMMLAQNNSNMSPAQPQQGADQNKQMQPGDQANKPSDMPTKFLLAGGSSPTQADQDKAKQPTPGQPNGQKKADPQQEQQPQLLV